MKCPICNTYKKSKQELIDHMEEVHADEFPKDWSANHYYYYLTHGNNDKGHCMMCKVEVDFNEAIGRPPKLCGKQKCKDDFSKMVRDRTRKKYGERSDEYESNKQRTALANRKLTKRYKWSDGTEKDYTGNQEQKLLYALDNLLEFPSNEVISPCPFDVWYKDEDGKRRLYIPDAYIISLNLVIEVKEDRENNPNTHPKILKIDRVREGLKDKRMKELNQFHYFKYMGKDDLLIKDVNDIILMNSENEKTNKTNYLYNLHESTLMPDDAKIEDIYMGLLSPKTNPDIITDVIFSYSYSFNQFFRYDYETNKVVTNSLTESPYKDMHIVVRVYTGELSIGDKFFKDIEKYTIENTELINNQYHFFAKIINLFAPNTFDNRYVDQTDMLNNDKFNTIYKNDNLAESLNNFNKDLLNSFMYMTELNETINDDKLFSKLDNSIVNTIHETYSNLPIDTKMYMETSTSDIILINNNKAINIGKEITNDIYSKIHVLDKF